MATARRQKGNALRPQPRRQPASSTWPPAPAGDKPWYVDEWSFGEAPPPQPAPSGMGKSAKWLLAAGAIAIFVLVAVGVTFLFII